MCHRCTNFKCTFTVLWPSAPSNFGIFPFPWKETTCLFIVKDGSLNGNFVNYLYWFGTLKNSIHSWALVAHACNPSWSGGSRFEASLGKQFRESLSQKKAAQKQKNNKKKTPKLVEWLKVWILDYPSTTK
jgi:hypothetical protein